MQQGFQPLHIKDELICGLYDETLQTDILAKASHLIKLEDVIKHAEAYESAQRDQSTLHKSNESTIARTSIYQQQKHQQLSNNPKLSEKINPHGHVQAVEAKLTVNKDSMTDT